jgi:uncharacterized lipoprotein YmbA
MRSLLAALALCATLAVLASCASTQPSRFYLLSDLPALETADPVASVGEGLTIGIGPITLPKYLERPQIATRANRHELRFAEFERWAEPLDTNVARALADHLARLMPRHRLLVFPWPRGTPIAYQVTLEVTHFFGTVGGESVLLVDWSLSREEEKATLVRRTSRFRAPVVAQEYEALVAAMSQTIAALGQEIASAIGTLGQSAPTR